ncbi:MAG TPA: lysophospholipid acyltransferase family protein [Burkholderiales bacterium]|jgi:1-acyl-sn-glycerol-3-phosphate acyltransferase|nr:lysophospholipid acyltransferase family protein [Burkholderiales bacterium]
MSPRPRHSTPRHLQAWRALRLGIHLLQGVLTVALLFPVYGVRRREAAVARWSAGLLAILNVAPRVHGLPSGDGSRPRVLVANHVSWLDIQVIHAVWQIRFVAKSEVRDWPLIGWLSARTGTLFIERGSGRHAARINQAIHAAFEQGFAVGVFPEGTTTEGDRLGKFHASLLQPAVDEVALVCPVALRYVADEGELCVAASYVGETTLLESMRAILAQPRIEAQLHFLPSIDAKGRTRRELAQLTQQAIAEKLNLPVSGTTPGTPADPPA